MAKPRGRPSALTAEERGKILGILWTGGSPTLAASYVGCAVRTISRLMQSDEAFAQQAREAQEASEVAYLKSIREAAKEGRYWRAAAWALERIDPQRYAARRPDVITFEQIRRLIAQLADIINAEVPIEHRENILKRLNDICGGLQNPPKKGTRSHDA